MYGRMPIVTTGSTYTEKKVRERARLRECRFIPNGVDLEKFDRDRAITKRPLVLTVGMLKRRKGVDIAVEAIARVHKKVPDVRYVIVADDTNDSFSQAVHTRVSKLALQDVVEFRQGISDEELLRLYNEARVFVLLARSNEDAFEGFPMVYYEANACGTPIVTTGGSQEDPDSAASAIETLLLDEKKFMQMSAAAEREARAHTWDKIARLLLTMYKDTIAAS